jgi:hypothetical protein
MNNCCICWFFTDILLEILIFKGLTARRIYKSFGVKGVKSVSQMKLIVILINFILKFMISCCIKLLQ